MQQIDLTLVRQASRGDESAVAALIAHMMPTIRKGAASNTAPGLDFEDAVQEGLIGLFRAIHGFSPDSETPFAGYAAACVYHAQADARRKALRRKNDPLNNSVPLSEGESLPNPEDLAIASEQYADILSLIKKLLSPLEQQALLAEMDGRSTAEIAAGLGKSPKAVANALARARRKLRTAI